MPWLAPEQIARLIFNFFHFSKLSLKYRSQSLYKRKELETYRFPSSLPFQLSLLFREKSSLRFMESAHQKAALFALLP